MQLQKIAVLVGIIAIFIGLVLFSFSGRGNAQECQVVRINAEKTAGGTALRLEPQNVEISKGDCVIWLNWAPRDQVEVKFAEDGKKCSDNTEAAVGFEMKPENCYVATLVGVGRTASLRFKEVGTFNYVIESSPEDRPRTGLYDGTSQELKVKGTIIVK